MRDHRDTKEHRRRPAPLPVGSLVGALLLVVIVHVMQFGSVEGATGTVGRTLLHSVSAAQGCAPEGGEPPKAHPLVVRALAAYESALQRAARSGVPGNKQPRGLAPQLSRGRNNALEALGGRIPPERALQLTALTIPLRSDGALRSVRFVPSPTVADLCR